MQTVLVTEKEYAKAQDVFAADTDLRILPAPPDENPLASAIRDHQARAVIVGVDRYVGPLYEALASGGQPAVIARFGVGHDGIDKSLAQKNGIFVTNTPDVLNRSVTEHTFWLLGALARKVVFSDAAIRRKEFPSTSGIELYDKTLLVVGAGAIGLRVAKIARVGFGMKVIAADRIPLEQRAAACGMETKEFLHEHCIKRYTTDIDTALPDADIITLHIASHAETFHFISADRLEKMKPTALLVNTARGPIIDEEALFTSLQQKRIAGAALDVFENEPYQPTNPECDLRKLDNIVLTSHLGSSTAEANHRMGEAALRNIRLFFDNRFDEMDTVG